MLLCISTLHSQNCAVFFLHQYILVMRVPWFGGNHINFSHFFCTLQPRGMFPVDQVKVVEKVPSQTFAQNCCFQVSIVH